MSLSEVLITEWAAMCGEIGRDLPITDIAPGLLVHNVRADEPPIESDGVIVRQVSLAYDMEDFANELTQ